MFAHDLIRLEVASRIAATLCVTLKTLVDAEKLVPYSVALADKLIEEVKQTSKGER